MGECPVCGRKLEKAQMGWIEFIFPNKRGIFIGTLPDFDWGDYAGARIFGWIEEWRYAQLSGLYCRRGHIDMKTAETARE